MPELLIARKINSFDEVVKASIIGKKKKFHNLIRTDMNDMINERDKELDDYFIGIPQSLIGGRLLRK